MVLKRAKNEVFQVLRKVIAWSFSIFYMKLQRYKDLKSVQMILFGNKFALKFFCEKEPNMRFLRCYRKSLYGTFLIFCIKLEILSLKKDPIDFLGKFMYGGFRK